MIKIINKGLNRKGAKKINEFIVNKVNLKQNYFAKAYYF